MDYGVWRDVRGSGVLDSGMPSGAASNSIVSSDVAGIDLVSSNPVRVGTISRNADKLATFSYDESYLNLQAATPLSLSLPLRFEPYAYDEMRPYFEGLLPEGAAKRDLAMALGRDEADWLGLLLECGLDCIGDVIINREAFDDTPSYEPLLKEQLEKMANVKSEAARIQGASRLSVAGTQSKCGLFHDDLLPMDEGWFQPKGSSASNYIVKFANDQSPYLLVIEKLCIDAARSCGVLCADTKLINLGRGMLCSKRFDRVTVGHTVRRLHQEDLTQAFGRLPGSKYAELESGTVQAVAKLVRKLSIQPARDISNLLTLCCFNYLIGNCDNHLKNLSVLHAPDGRHIELAPAYDIVGTTIFDVYTRDMGMDIGSAHNIDDVAAANLLEMSIQMGVSKSALRKTSARITFSVRDALDRAGEQLEALGFTVAPELAYDLQEDMAPRLVIMEEVANGKGE